MEREEKLFFDVKLKVEELNNIMDAPGIWTHITYVCLKSKFFSN